MESSTPSVDARNGLPTNGSARNRAEFRAEIEHACSVGAFVRSVENETMERDERCPMGPRALFNTPVRVNQG